MTAHPEGDSILGNTVRPERHGSPFGLGSASTPVLADAKGRRRADHSSLPLPYNAPPHPA